MAKGNDRARRRARSTRRRCKPNGKWATQEAARNWIERFAEEHPLKALGMVAYPCPTCGMFHVGRGKSN